MRKSLSERLLFLEQERSRLLRQIERQEGADGEAAIVKVEAFLRISAIEQGSDESLAMSLARALNISYDELSDQIEEEVDPIHRFLTDNGTLVEIEQRKAAGTWPSGSA
jgi:hypothetical protein